MRKILSVIMVIAMLVTSILPAVANVVAADADAVSVEMSTVGFVENEDGTASADIDLDITNNPGLTDLVIVVYYNTTEITGTELVADANYVTSTTYKSTHKNVKSYFADAGVATAADISAVKIDLAYYDADGEPFTYGETGVVGTLTISAEAFDAGMAAEIGIIVADAYDVDGVDIAIATEPSTMLVEAKPEDPYATKYDVESFPEDQFVVNVTGTKVYENGFVDGEIPTADVNVEFYGNNEANNPFGVWGYRAFVYYPAELTAIAYANGDIFKDSEMQKFEDCATNIDVTEEAAKDANGEVAAQSYYFALKGFEYIDYTTYAEDGIEFSVIQHLGTNWYDCTYGDGVLETITFQLPEDAAAGDKWEIGICAAADDICFNGGSTPEAQDPSLEPAPIEGVVYNDGYIEVISVKEESFDNFTFTAEDVTVSADSAYATVNVKVEGLNAEDYPYGFWAARIFFYYPSELSLTNVELGKIVPEGGFTLGTYDFNLVEAVKDPAYENNTVVQGAPLALKDKGLVSWDEDDSGNRKDYAWNLDDFRLTTVYFEAPSDAQCITKNGQYATLTFKLPDGAAAGDSWYVGLATSYDGADVIGYMNDPALSTTVAEKLVHALDDGSITLGGDVVVPEEPVHVHELQYTAAVEAGCHYTGNAEYWYCAGCDTVFADEAATQITNRLNVVIPAKGSNLLVAMDAVEPDCHYDGNIAYWICYECNQVWADEALTQLTNIKNVILPATGSENLQHVDAKAPTFDAEGNIEYWYCEDCGQVWQDEALTQLTNRMNVIIPRLTQATVTVGTATVVKGYNANVAVTIANNPGLFIGKFVVTYDASALTLVEATNGDVFADEYVIINTEVEGQITIYLENAELADAAGEGVLANLVFATNASGETELAIEAVEAINVAGEDVAIEVAAGKVSVTDCAHEGEETTYVVVTPATVYAEGYAEYICNHCEGVAAVETLPKLAGIVVYEWQEAIAGEQTAFVVDLINNPGVWALSATFAYDPYVLEFVRVDSYLFTADEFSYSVADGVVTVYVEADDLNNVELDGAAFLLVFDSISCGYSDIDVELVADNTINAAGENVAFEAVDGSVIVKCNLQHSPFVAPSDVNGWQEYWYCEYCGSVYADEQGRYITNRMNCYIPANSITLDEVVVNEGEDAVVNVNLDSNYGIWSLGLKVTYDAEALTLKAIESGIFAIDEYSYSVEDGVITIFVENADVADVTDTGAAFSLVFETAGAGYYAVAAELIADNTINASSENVVFAVADGSVDVVHVCDLEYVPAVDATCCQNGMQEYWYCADCDAVYSDAEGRYVTNRRNLTIPATAEIIYVEAVEATCCQNGSAAYYYCSECDAVYDEDFILTNRKNLTIPATAEIVYVEAVEANCHQNGSAAYYYCSECDAVYDEDFRLTNRKNLTIPATAEIIYVEAVEASCYADGNVEYWYCSECDAVFADAALTQLTNRKNVVVPAGQHNIIHFDAVEAGCHNNGNIEFWYCSECETFWQDAALTQITNSKNVITPATGGDVAHFEAVEPACHYDGNIEYWVCYECEKVWQDEALTQLTNIKNVVLPATGSVLFVHFDAVEAGCHWDGNIEYWICYECEQVWADEALTQLTNIKNVVVPALGSENLEHYEAVEPTCHQNGNIEYWYCPDCMCVWQDEALTQITNLKNVIVPATAEIVYVEAVEAGCHYEGNTEYWYCSDCDAVYADAALTQLTNRKNVIVPALGSENLVHFEAVEAGCHYDGNIEYWFCADCEQYWQDEALTQLTNAKNVITPATGSDLLVHVDAVEAGCHYDGNTEYWICYECEQVWADEALTQLTNIKNVIIPATGSDLLVHMDAVEAGCHFDGNIEYWICYECEQVWADEALTQLTNIKNVVVPATGSENLVHVDAVEAGCHYDGNIEYWYCADCECYWQDEALTQLTNAKNVIVPATGSDLLVHMDAVEAGCHFDGNIEYWICYECEQVWADEALTQLTNIKNVVLPATGSENVEHYEAVEPTCHQNGNIEYWYCADCECYWQDEALTQLTNAKNVIVPATAEIVYVEAVEASCHQTGNVEYWYCSECDAVFADAALTQLTNRKNVIIPALGELTYVAQVDPSATTNGRYEYWYCDVCDAIFADAAGTQLTNRLNLTILAPISEVILAHSAADKTYDGSTFYVTSKANQATTAIGFRLSSGVQYTASEGVTIVKSGPYTYFKVADGGNYTVTLSTKDYTVVIEIEYTFDDEIFTDYIASHTTDTVNVGDNSIDVVSKLNATSAAVGLVLKSGVTYNVSEGVTVVKSGPYTYFKVTEQGTYYVDFTVSGRTYTYELNYDFVADCFETEIQAHSSSGFDVDGTVYTVYAKAGHKNTAIGFKLRGGFSIVDADGLEIVKSGPYTYVKTYAAGEYTITIANAAGVKETYTIKFVF